MNERLTVAGIGELLWDVFPSHKHPGGAPANFACHCHRLGALAEKLDAVMVDTVGAGDSLPAALCMGLLKGWPLDKVNSFANCIEYSL